MKKRPAQKPSADPNMETCKRSICPVSCVLDLVGDKWTMLVIRDLFRDKTLYSEFQTSPENIPTNILADRLKRLQQSDIISKQAYQQHPPRYQYSLTEKGRDLWPLLKEIIQWGNQHIPGTLDASEIVADIELRDKKN